VDRTKQLHVHPGRSFYWQCDHRGLRNLFRECYIHNQRLREQYCNHIGYDQRYPCNTYGYRYITGVFGTKYFTLCKYRGRFNLFLDRTGFLYFYRSKSNDLGCDHFENGNLFRNRYCTWMY
jgi:hypothetical protein